MKRDEMWSLGAWREETGPADLDGAHGTHTVDVKEGTEDSCPMHRAA